MTWRLVAAPVAISLAVTLLRPWGERKDDPRTAATPMK